jgi:hypothetical protein
LFRPRPAPPHQSKDGTATAGFETAASQTLGAPGLAVEWIGPNLAAALDVAYQLRVFEAPTLAPRDVRCARVCVCLCITCGVSVVGD